MVVVLLNGVNFVRSVRSTSYRLSSKSMMKKRKNKILPKRQEILFNSILTIIPSDEYLQVPMLLVMMHSWVFLKLFYTTDGWESRYHIVYDDG